MAVAVVQARMGSTRLPGKVLRPLGDGTVVSWVVRAAVTAGLDVVVAVPDLPEDDVLAEHVHALGTRVHRGPADDVLRRFVGALADSADEDIVVRLTADCPLLDPEVVHSTVATFAAGGLDYVSTTLRRSLPRGLDVEVTSAGVLRRVDREATGVERVHVMPYLYTDPHRFAVGGLVFEPAADDLRVTIDEAADLDLVARIVALLGDRPPSWRDVVDLLRGRPDLVAINASVEQKPVSAG
jgi:spore coat polysaccharide biosynthesis protein SpsF